MSYDKTEILEELSDEVFRKFFRADFLIGEYYNSPLRNDDSSPSFNIFESYKKSKILLFKDWGGKSGNCIDFVMLKEKCSFIEALRKINEEIVDRNTTNNQRVYKTDSGDNISFFLNLDKYGNTTYTHTDIWYWEKLHRTSLKTVKRNRIYSVKEIRINESSYYTTSIKSPIYCILEIVNKVNYYKLYIPLNKDKKWLSNLRGVAETAIGGLHLLPAFGKELIITKSAKDRTILNGLGYNVVNTQGEDIGIHLDILNDLKERFQTIYLLYDNDWSKPINIGKNLGDKYQKLWNVNRILIPDEVHSTDIGELIQRTDRDIIKKLIEKWKK